MSALGHKRTLGHLRLMSALPPKADIAERHRDVRFVPKADIKPLLDHLIGTGEEWRRDRHADGLCRSRVDDKLESGWLLLLHRLPRLRLG